MPARYRKKPPFRVITKQPDGNFWKTILLQTRKNKEGVLVWDAFCWWDWLNEYSAHEHAVVTARYERTIVIERVDQGSRVTPRQIAQIVAGRKR